MLENIKKKWKKIKRKPGDKKSYFWYVLVVFLLCIGMTAGMNKPDEIPYEEFQADVESGEIDTLYIDRPHMEVRYTLLNEETRDMDAEGRDKVSENEKEWKRTQYPSYENFVKDMLEQDVRVKWRVWNTLFDILLADPLNVITLIVLIFFIKMQAQYMGGSIIGKKTGIKPENSKLSFEDVIGHDEALEDIKFAVQLLEDDAICKQLHVTPPKGIILSGPPGTGKTMIAKAMANEAGMNFYNIDSAGLIEMFVGMGAKRIRDIFETARDNKPAIIFFDEIDAIGRKRSSSSDNREYDQTLDALLQEMDGFATESGVFVIAATNRISDLDPALLRPGRFDRKIILNPPKNWNVRAEMMKRFLKDDDIQDVDIEHIARQITGFSGADIQNLVNEAKFSAVVAGKDKLTTAFFDEAIEKVIFSGNRTKHAYQNDAKIVAYHEAGHAVSMFLDHIPIARISIVPNTSGVGGMVVNSDLDTDLHSKAFMKAKIRSLYAGRIAEELFFGEDDATTGASNDLEEATKLIYAYMKVYGFDKEYSLLTKLKDDDYISLSNKQDELEMKKLSNQFYQEAERMLRQNRLLIEALAQAVIQQETIDGKRVEQILQEVDSVGGQGEEKGVSCKI